MAWWQRIIKGGQTDRVSCDLEGRLAVRLADSPELVRAQWPVRVVDLSPAGCGLASASLSVDRFHLHRCLAEPEGCPLEVEIHLPGRNVFTSRARLAWIKRDYNDPDWTYRLGVQFTSPPGLPRNWRRLIRG